MFVGAYWSQRKESRQQAASRIALFLGTIASKNEALSTWFLKGRSKAQGRTKLSLDADSIGRELVANRRDIGGEPMLEVGFSMGIWNGESVSFDATIGAFSPYVQNSVVLSFDDDGDRLNETDWRGLLDSAIFAFEPEHGVVTSGQRLARAGARSAWDAGLLTYERSTGVREHSDT